MVDKTAPFAYSVNVKKIFGLDRLKCFERKEYIVVSFGRMNFGQRGNAVGWKRSCNEIIEVHPGAGFVNRRILYGLVAEHVFTR